MSTNTQNTTITPEAIAELRNTIRATWITSVQAIYKFGKTYSKAEIEKSLNEIGMSLTKKANEFTGAAKLGLAEFHNGKWKVCDGQVSRYARVCEHLNSLKVSVDGVEAALEGKTMTELVQNTKKTQEVTDEQFKRAVQNIQAAYTAQSLFDFGDGKVHVSNKAGLKPGPNMAIVICDMEGNITAIRHLADDQDKEFRKKVWVKANKAEVADNSNEPDVTEQAAAVAEAA